MPIFTVATGAPFATNIWADCAAWIPMGVLLVEFLVFGPPFPRYAIGELGDFLTHGAAIVEGPLGFLLIGHGVGVHANALVQGFLHAKQFAKLIGLIHGPRMRCEYQCFQGEVIGVVVGRLWA